jgi:NADH-quinone oxidoreductase subunit N
VNPSVGMLSADTLQLPHVNYAAVAPMLILFSAAVVGILVEAFAPRTRRYPIHLGLGLAALVAALVTVIIEAGTHELVAAAAIAIDGPALFLQGALLVLGIVALLLVGERSLEPGGAFVAEPAAQTRKLSAAAPVTAGTEADRAQVRRREGSSEVFPLLLFALAGMMLFVSANDLLTMFVALEVFSLPLYLMCGLARRRRLLSQEAAMKYFLLGAFSSAFFLFGIAMLYGFAGQVQFSAINSAISGSTNSVVLLLVGLSMVSIGLLFKVAAVPFHVWTPDVYQGAPTPITGFMAACTKTAAFGGLLRVLYVAFQGAQWNLRLVLGVIAVLTMIIGSILAVTQTDVKRLLAYSSIANAGYLLVGTLALTKDGLSSSLFYLVAYGFTVLASFGVVTLVRDADGEATHLSRWAGLGRRSPLVAGLFTFLMLAFAGIPLTSGFTSKYAVFGAAVGAHQVWLVIFGVVSSMILAFPYLRVVVMMWLSEPGKNTPTVSIPGVLTSAALGIGGLITLLLGVLPAPLLDLSNKAAEFIR